VRVRARAEFGRTTRQRSPSTTDVQIHERHQGNVVAEVVSRRKRETVPARRPQCERLFIQRRPPAVREPDLRLAIRIGLPKIARHCAGIASAKACTDGPDASWAASRTRRMTGITAPIVAAGSHSTFVVKNSNLVVPGRLAPRESLSTLTGTGDSTRMRVDLAVSHSTREWSWKGARQ
jgi:hypothetical protein